MPTRMARMHKAVLALVASSVFAAYGSEAPTPLSRHNTIEVTATVTAVDINKRLVSLKNAKGDTETIYAGTDVRNLEQVKAGDIVTVRYYEAVAAEVTVPGQATQASEKATAILHAEEGSRPGGAVGQALTTTVEIESVDKSANSVTFKRPDGAVRTLSVENPDSQRFIKGLKRGDRVQVTYLEAVAVSVEAAK